MSPGTRVPAGLSPARAVAYAVIRRVFEQDAYADRALRQPAAELDPRDRALATALVFGTVQRAATLDHVIATLSRRPLARLDPPVQAALRLGVFQLLFLDRVAAHAAVSESVELVRRHGHGGEGLVNAVLRRASREGQSILEGLREDTAPAAAIRHSVPEWLARMWWEELGPGEARSLLRAINDPAEAAVRVNGLVSSPEVVAAALPVPTEPAPDLPEGLVLRAPFDVHGSELFAQGTLMPQSRGSMLVARALDPRPGQRVLDLCAAPGGKTTQLAALMAAQGEVVAVERHPGRAAALERTCARMAAANVRVEVGDAARFALRGEASRSAGEGAPFDRVLVDPPCSGLGTLQSRPDLRWRARPEAIAELAELQGRILAAGAGALAAGGTLVYSVCTISRREGVEVVERFLAAHPEFTAEDLAERWPAYAAPTGPWLQLRPDRHGTDGFFLACLRR